jgi:hypothetical protein
MGAGGCEGDSGRLADYAQNSVEQQTRQNDQIARQNLEVTQQNRQVAEGAQKLVAADAQARQELMTAQKSLQEGLHVERMTLDQQRQGLEDDRRQIARERYWEPLVAEAIGGFAVLLACLLPLVICAYVLRSLQTETGDEAILNELLVTELMSERPQLLLPPANRPAALEREVLPSDAGEHDVVEHDDMNTDPPPF